MPTAGTRNLTGNLRHNPLIIQRHFSSDDGWAVRRPDSAAVTWRNPPAR